MNDRRFFSLIQQALRRSLPEQWTAIPDEGQIRVTTKQLELSVHLNEWGRLTSVACLSTRCGAWLIVEKRDLEYLRKLLVDCVVAFQRQLTKKASTILMKISKGDLNRMGAWSSPSEKEMRDLALRDSAALIYRCGTDLLIVVTHRVDKGTIPWQAAAEDQKRYDREMKARPLEFVGDPAPTFHYVAPPLSVGPYRVQNHRMIVKSFRLDGIQKLLAISSQPILDTSYVTVTGWKEHLLTAESLWTFVSRSKNRKGVPG